jgi:hypothetical protein
MDYSHLLPPKKTVEDFIAPKFQLEDAEKIHKFLTLDNPLTYMVFLDKRPDLTEEEREVIIEIIKRLQENEALEYKLSYDKMISVEEKQEEPPQTEEKITV